MSDQTVKTESVGACKMHSKYSLVVSCIVTAPVFSVGCCEAFRWGETLACSLAYCKHSINGSSGRALLSLFRLFSVCPSSSWLFFFFPLFYLLLSPSLLQALELRKERANPKTTRFIFLTPISVLIIIILTLNLLRYKNDFMWNLMNLNINVR